MKPLYLLLSVLLSIVSVVQGAGPACPAGMPLGAFQVTVTRATGSAPLPLNRSNRLEEGDKIAYSPILKPSEKRPGEVSIVLIAANPTAGDGQDYTVLEPKSASKPAEWKVPWSSALAVYVYGPSGLSARKLRGFVRRDQELVTQLADYAEKTEKTESVLQALNTYDLTGRTDGVHAAFEGFAGQYGISNKIDRSAPLDQQTLAALRTLNPALSAYDPIAPSHGQRVAQTTGLAATVAGMFLGSTVGLAAGSAALTLNLKTLMFPDTDFRSAYSNELHLCTAREANPSRKRLAYLWALRVPNSGPPRIEIGEANHVPERLATSIRVKVPDSDWRLVSRVRDWKLQPSSGDPVPVPVTPVTDGRMLELNLSKISAPPGRYTLTALWDWDPFVPSGDVVVAALGSFGNAKLTDDTANRLQERTGKQIVTLSGPTDFEFVERVTVVREGDKYATPVTVPFSLPVGPRRGPQDRLEMQVDTSGMTAGRWLLALTQQGGSTQTVPVEVVKAPPVIERLPVVVNCEMKDDTITISGEGLDRIAGLEAEGVRFDVESATSRSMTLRVTTDAKWEPGTRADLRVRIRDYPAPLVMAGALLLAGARPVIREVEPSIPTGLPIALRKGELLAGIMTNLLLRVDGADPKATLTLRCKGASGDAVTVRPGAEEDRVRLQAAQNGSMFVSVDGGRWPTGCVLTATLGTAESGRSKAVELGPVVRLPVIDSFRLTEESAGENMFFGVLTGRDLELVEKTGWEDSNGQAVTEIPAAIVGQGNQQSLKVRMPWPSPRPHAPLFIWLRGETEGRATTVRY